ncbi:sugar kinase [Thermoplasmatales archaeon ex4484_30]|nr:MAG: NAD(+)/NADH kinase [Thermoplasmata archaeon]OYT61564.1 MAG: sugar kinase [Thermoplasmatales archaeon ex4484_30]
MKWGIVCKPSDDSYKIGKSIYEMLHEALLEKKIASYLGKNGLSIEEIGREADGIIVVGGDGTILMTFQHTTKPVFSINTGRIGFLTEVEAEEAEEAMEKILQGEYKIEERIKIKSLLNDWRLPDAVNEIAIHTAHLGKILPFRVYINGEIVQEIDGDGLIVATPTGSTSHALSVGGPIVEPLLNVFIIAPMAPFRHLASPLVISAENRVRIEIEKEAQIAIDGLHIEDFTPDDKLEVMMSEKRARFMKLKNDFYEKIYKKLRFGKYK